jgi:hypothetical protein
MNFATKLLLLLALLLAPASDILGDAAAEYYKFGTVKLEHNDLTGATHDYDMVAENEPEYEIVWRDRSIVKRAPG